jgi:Uma2 family endonuclease
MASVPPTLPAPIFYPDSDGKPMSDNTEQFRWINTLFNNLSILYSEDPNVFVAGDNLWYPVEGRPDIRQAPDVYVVFGRPKGKRGSYKQWEENNVPIHVVFEILSPSNDVAELARKYPFYEEHGVEEYYVYDPETDKLEIYLRRGSAFRRQRKPSGFVSPRMKITFDLSGTELVVRYPDGRAFLSPVQMDAQRRATEQRLARLAELGRKARRGKATPEELLELERLEEEAGA